MDAEREQIIGQNPCCTRWKPTGEQLQFLKELYYNQMVRSPSTEEIERISLRLSLLGKIEGKNVFYWFQNQRKREKYPRKRPAPIATATAATAYQHGGGLGLGLGLGLGHGGAKRSKPETLSLFPMHGDSVSQSKQEVDGSQVSLELTLRPYSPKP